eukprot:TRINITY_DN59178_c0_g1_i1.p2 TRINITY_DN59178_c0_g1~~TRINITY_DN59178_c0_g1_i1.p2  ORF type:complete len:140 (+),score=3.70 TRINITY_DN59178_c0_g1_i1:1-420(+)
MWIGPQCIKGSWSIFSNLISKQIFLIFQKKGFTQSLFCRGILDLKDKVQKIRQNLSKNVEKNRHYSGFEFEKRKFFKEAQLLNFQPKENQKQPRVENTQTINKKNKLYSLFFNSSFSMYSFKTKSPNNISKQLSKGKTR